MKKVKMMKKYAELIANVGINANSKQDVMIKAPVEAYQFVRYLALELYNSKARSVSIDWYDSTITRYSLMHLAPTRLENVQKWEIAKEKELVDKNYAKVYIIGEDPSIFKSVNPDRLKRYNKARVEAFYPFSRIYNSDELGWCIAAVPTKAWARKVFPKLSPTQAVLHLWDKIYEACYINEDTDPVEAWEGHIAKLDKHAAIMSNYAFKELHYKNSLGTDIHVGLAQGHIWSSAQAIQSRNGMKFVPNIPTQEIFTMPDRRRINGIVFSSKPLSYNGVIIDDFWFEFRDGKVVSFGAKVGKDKLDEILHFDDNSNSLGEAALVPFDSPISKQNIVYGSTLFDENASCHLALGESFAENLKGSDKMTEQEMFEAGGNISKIHVDFMIGTKDLSIDGIKEDGSIISVFRDGNFVF